MVEDGVQVTLSIGELLAALSAILGGFGAVITWLLAFTLTRMTRLQDKFDALAHSLIQREATMQSQTHDHFRVLRQEFDEKIQDLRQEFGKEVTELRRIASYRPRR